MKTEKEILDALNVLRNTCIENKGECFKCMLRTESDDSIDCGVIVNSNGETHLKLSSWKLKNYENPRLILN